MTVLDRHVSGGKNARWVASCLLETDTVSLIFVLLNTHTHWGTLCLWKYSVWIHGCWLRLSREEKADLTDDLVDFPGVL